MSYAKLCKYGCQTQIIWDKVQNRFNDNATGEAHTREKCEAAKNKSTQQQIPISTKSPAFDHIQAQPTQTLESISLAQLHTKIDNLAIGLAKVMSILQNHIENNPTTKDNAILRQQVTELEAVIKKREDNFVPANQVPVKKEEGVEYDEHVREMVRKGEQDEELEIQKMITEYDKNRMEAIVTKMEYMLKDMEKLTKTIKEQNAYIKHLEKMLDERLRVVQ